MFTKKLEDQFSADLLNTVRGILGEAKHDKDCECEKCEDEEVEQVDEMKNISTEKLHALVARGDSDPVGMSPAFGMQIKAARKELQRRKKPGMKEEAELDEISKATMGRYINKAKDSIDLTAWRQGHKEAGAGNPSGALEKKLTKRHKGISMAVNKLTKEEAEQIDEISKATMGRYINRAKDQIDTVSYRQGHRDSRGAGGDPISRKHERKLSKRHGGIELAISKLTKEESEQLDELSPKTMGSYVNKAAYKIGDQGITAGLKIQNNEPAGKNLKKMGNRQKGIERAVKKLTKEEQDFIDALNNDMFEEIEIAEANLKVGDYTATAEKSQFHKKGYRPHLKNAQGKTSYLAGVAYKSPEHAAGEAAAYHKGYTSGPGKASERGADYAVRAYRHKNKEHMHEEVELEEGRGRPPKEGSPAWHAKQKQADDDMVALGMQLRKAKSINKKVRFMDGKEHDIHPNHINRFDDHMDARKTSQEKATFQKQAHKSHAEFVKAVSAPVPKASRDTGEIVKYRH